MCTNSYFNLQSPITHKLQHAIQFAHPDGQIARSLRRKRVHNRWIVAARRVDSRVILQALDAHTMMEVAVGAAELLHAQLVADAVRQIDGVQGGGLNRYANQSVIV